MSDTPRIPRNVLLFWFLVGLLIVLLAGRRLLDSERIATGVEDLFPIAFLLFGGTLIVLSVARWLRNPPAPSPPGRKKKRR